MLLVILYLPYKPIRAGRIVHLYLVILVRLFLSSIIETAFLAHERGEMNVKRLMVEYSRYIELKLPVFETRFVIPFSPFFGDTVVYVKRA